MDDALDGPRVDRGDEGSEGSAESEGNRVAKSNAEITDRESEGKAADAPEDAEEQGVAYRT